MNKKIFLSVLLFSCSFNAAAVNIGNSAYNPKNKLPEPVSGIHVVSDSEITMPESMRKNATFKECNEQGYIYSESTYPRELLNTKYQAANEIKENKNNTNPYDTHLKENINEIKLAFPFNGISFIKAENIIGYAAAGGYQNGWTGIKEFFTDPKFGTCSLTLYNIFLSKGGARLGKSAVTYKINKKPTTMGVEGSVNSGFLYTIAWFDNTFVHVFECANMNFDKDIIMKMVDYGRLIDKSLPR